MTVMAMARAWLLCSLLVRGDFSPESLDLLQQRLVLHASRPNILMIISDDQGWGHLSAHRSANQEEKHGQVEIFTPKIDGLMREGIKLERHYAASDSSPSRCSLMSGRLPAQMPNCGIQPANPQMFWNHSGMNVSGFFGMPRYMTSIGQKLKEANYETHYVGKWDIGYASPEHTPWGRGFGSFLGFLQAGNNYWNEKTGSQTAGKIDMKMDICLNKPQDFSLYNATYRGAVNSEVYAELGCNRTWGRDTAFTPTGCNQDNATDCLPENCFEEAMLLEYAKNVIQKHSSTNPLFMIFSHHTPHEPRGVPRSYLQKLDRLVKEAMANARLEQKVRWTETRKFKAAMLLYMDDAVGKLIDALKERGIYDNTLVIFFSDNGSALNLREAGNNHPLKGGKWSQWEGGVRTIAFVSGGLIPHQRRGSEFHGVMHIADWYATLCSIAGVDPSDLSAKHILLSNGQFASLPLSSRPQWRHILDGTNGRPDSLQLDSTALLRWPYKLLTGIQNYSFWAGPVWPNCSSDRPKFPFLDVFAKKVFLFEGERDLENVFSHDCGAGCLYNVEADPGEHMDLSSLPEYASLLAGLQQELAVLNADIQVQEPDYGTSPAVEVCLQALQTSTYGPWVDAGKFYTEWPNGEKPPSAERAAADFTQIMAVQKLIAKGINLTQLVSQMSADSDTNCLES